MKLLSVVFFTVILLASTISVESVEISFPPNFKFGAASASYQVEGAWNEGGKSPNVWDTLTHKDPGYVADSTNGDVAANSYHFYQKDIDALDNIGFDAYRFSISWSRIIPNGARTNQEGIDYYNRLIDGLLAKGIEPLVTMFHWDLPQYLQDLGGFTNPLIVEYFKEYADVLFEHFGDRVKRWITFNEPSVFCGEGYGYTTKAPAIASPGVGDYLCSHYILLSHAAAYHLYKEKHFQQQQGEVAICLNTDFNYPADSSVDPSVVEMSMEFNLGKYAHPIFTEEGGYPQVMIDQIGNKSLNEGRPRSRLPVFTQAQKDYLRGTSDFLAVNYYTTRLVALREEDPNLAPSWWADANVDTFADPSWDRAKSDWLYSYPQGLRDLLILVKNKYNNPTVMVTENGWSDDGQLEDDGRIKYIKGHLASISRAISEDGCDVIGYVVWSLTDNSEWKVGLTERFGIHYINFISEEKERVPKKSAYFFKEMLLTRTFDIDE